MANIVQATTKKRMLDLLLALGALKVTLVDLADYTYSSAHDFIDDVPAGARTATATLTGITTTGGVLKAVVTTLPSVSGDQSEGLVLWIDTGVEAASPYLTFIDSGVGGFPVTPDGRGILINWDPSGIIAL